MGNSRKPSAQIKGKVHEMKPLTAEELIMTAYQSIPDNGCFFPEDYKHFARS